MNLSKIFLIFLNQQTRTNNAREVGMSARKHIQKSCGNCANFGGKVKNWNDGEGICDFYDSRADPDDKKPCKYWKGRKYKRNKYKSHN
jgi:hypothetical protein